MKSLAVLLSVVLALAFAEAALRIARFEYHIYPVVQFGWPDPQAIAEAYRSDPDVVWTTLDFTEKLRYARQDHPAVVFMGDSCTEFGTYPSLTLARLGGTNPALATGVKFGVGGWSSEQGLTLLHRDIVTLPVKPRVVTFYFGWNDHWVALGPSDPQLTFVRKVSWLADHARLMQLAIKVWMGRFGSVQNRPNRVPIERYRANLRAMIQESRAAGIRPVVITAPSNHIRGHEPEYLKLRHVRSLDEVVPLHDAYMAATRQVAREDGATLCDAAQVFGRLPPPRGLYFRSDGIHLSPVGDRAMADIVAGCILEAAR